MTRSVKLLHANDALVVDLCPLIITVTRLSDGVSIDVHEEPEGRTLSTTVVTFGRRKDFREDRGFDLARVVTLAIPARGQPH